MTPFIFDNGTYSINRNWVAQETRAIKRRYEEGYGVAPNQWRRSYEAAMFRAEMETDITQRVYDKQQAERNWAIEVGIAEINRRMDQCVPFTKDVEEHQRLVFLARFLKENGYA